MNVKREVRKCILTVYLVVDSRLMSELQENVAVPHQCCTKLHSGSVLCSKWNQFRYFTSYHRASTKGRRRIRFGILSWPLPTSSVISSPLIQRSPLSFFSRSFWVFLFFLVLGGSNSKPVPVWRRNPSSVYVQPTSISAVWFKLPLVVLCVYPQIFILR